MTTDLRAVISGMLTNCRFSPEQTASISATSVYRYIRRDREQGGGIVRNASVFLKEQVENLPDQVRHPKSGVIMSKQDSSPPVSRRLRTVNSPSRAVLPEFFHPRDVQNPCQVVSQRHQTELSPALLETPHQKLMKSVSDLQCSERMFNNPLQRRK